MPLLLDYRQSVPKTVASQQNTKVSIMQVEKVNITLNFTSNNSHSYFAHLIFFFFVLHIPDPSMVSLTRSGSFMSSPRQQQQQLPRMPSTDGTGAASDDSMHEKYFKSVENTPVTRRRNVQAATASATSVQQKHSSDSSPQSPISPQNNAQQKATRPSVLSSLATTFTDAPNPCLSSHKDDADLINLDLVSKPER